MQRCDGDAVQVQEPAVRDAGPRCLASVERSFRPATLLSHRPSGRVPLSKHGGSCLPVSWHSCYLGRLSTATVGYGSQVGVVSCTTADAVGSPPWGHKGAVCALRLLPALGEPEPGRSYAGMVSSVGGCGTLGPVRPCSAPLGSAAETGGGRPRARPRYRCDDSSGSPPMGPRPPVGPGDTLRWRTRRQGRQYMIDVVFGVDVGTSSTKGVVVDTAGRILSQAVRTHAADRPRPGHVEMDAQVWWDEFVSLAAELLVRDDVTVRAVGVSGMGPCTLLVDDTGEPVRPGSTSGRPRDHPRGCGDGPSKPSSPCDLAACSPRTHSGLRVTGPSPASACL
ncbi:FGGY family carbohydrate kinase [Streptomyces fagopyri]|uniref:FGGY family carbohydrate kinase n=1 Tax=Streptomyces fagopyri TaxID=2662397 RepID=UPI00382F5007